MTAEQLEELKRLKEQLGKDVFYGEERPYNMRKHNPLHLDAINMLDDLARRVIAADKLAEAIQIAIHNFHGRDADLRKMMQARDAYREASK